MIDDTIAECRLVARDAAGDEKPVVIRIGRPRQAQEHTECPVIVEGIQDKPRMIYGEDTLQALLLAIRHARSLIEIEAESGTVFFLPDGQSEFRWEGYPILSPFRTDES